MPPSISFVAYGSTPQVVGKLSRRRASELCWSQAGGAILLVAISRVSFEIVSLILRLK